MHSVAASAPDNKMAADLSRRGRRVPAGTGNDIPAAESVGNRRILTSGVRCIRTPGLFLPESFGSRVKPPSCAVWTLRVT